jgi:hypothetical protein
VCERERERERERVCDYHGAVTALVRRCEGAVKALLRLF